METVDWFVVDIHHILLYDSISAIPYKISDFGLIYHSVSQSAFNARG